MNLHRVVLLTACFVSAFARTDFVSYHGKEVDHDKYHSYIKSKSIRAGPGKEETTAEYWRQQARATVDEQLKKSFVTQPAKNVILFLGDGMSIPTLAAARAYLGQKSNKPGEETKLSFEKFPYVGLSKTYCVDRQVADSACSATAYLCGVKANEGTAGVTAAVELGDCAAMKNTSNHVMSVGYLSQLAGKRTGVVTTTRITHASPSGVYAHTAHRDWESDTNIAQAGHDPKVCPDIAHQLVHGETGKNLNVILGGGRWAFLPNTEKDEDGKPGYRSDGRNLIKEWQAAKANTSHKYVYNRDGLLKVSNDAEFVLGLFDSDHLPYNLDRDAKKTPSLQEMTEAAIKLLSQHEKGYFLFVEGGRIDHAHHETRARKALEETVEFQKAIQAAVELTDIQDTLIIVTSDHAHTLSVNGYPPRGNDILGIGGTGDDKLPYATLSYANGPGYRAEEDGHRHDISKDDLKNKEYEYPALVPLSSETHGGDDVGIFARGPYAHLLTGVLEQNVISHVIAYASCITNSTTSPCDLASSPAGLNNGTIIVPCLNPTFIVLLCSFFFLIKRIFSVM